MVQLLKQTQLFLDSRSTNSPQDQVEAAINYDGANDSLFHVSLTEFDMPSSAISLDSLNLPAIYLRMNLASTNSSSSTLSGSATRTTELQSSNILGKIQITPGMDRIRWIASTDDASMAVVPTHSIENISLRLTDGANNDLSSLAFPAGVWNSGGAAWFGCTLRIANYNYFTELTSSGRRINTALNGNIM